jgi:hypothetical protein
MTDASTIRRDRLEFWKKVNQVYRNAKDTPSVLPELFDAFRRLDPDERAVVTQVVLEWLESLDEDVRFDALALITEFRISAALPSVQELATRLRGARTVSAPFELEKVDRIISALREAS